MTAKVINKINITAEAVFDYTDVLGLGRFDKRGLKADVEDYINLQNRDGRLLYKDYFRCKYLDERSGQALMLFLYRDVKLSIMQHWRLEGICLAEDWDEDSEDEGLIRQWLKQKLQEAGKGDWVLEQQLRAEADRFIGYGVLNGKISGLTKEEKTMSSIETVKTCLRNYQSLKMQTKNGIGGDILKEQVAFIENTINSLSGDDYRVIKGHFIDKRSFTMLAKTLFVHRTTVKRRIDEVIKTIAEVYEMRFGD